MTQLSLALAPVSPRKPPKRCYACPEPATHTVAWRGAWQPSAGVTVQEDGLPWPHDRIWCEAHAARAAKEMTDA